MPKLELQVNEKVFNKIKVLSTAFKLDSENISELLSQVIDRELDLHLIESAKKMLVSVGVDPGLLSSNQITGGPIGTRFNNAILEPIKSESETSSGVDQEDPIGMAGSLGVGDSEFDKMDVKLPDEEDAKNFIIPNNDDSEEERMGSVKDKNGKETHYSDPLMNDLQNMAEDEEFGEQESTIAAADNKNSRDSYDDDIDESSSTPDVLPVDFGIKSIQNEKAGADFFMKAMKGEQGDKTQRNKVTKKRIQTS